jgi:hypothetical protein
MASVRAGTFVSWRRALKARTLPTMEEPFVDGWDMKAYREAQVITVQFRCVEGQTLPCSLTVQAARQLCRDLDAHLRALEPAMVSER